MNSFVIVVIHSDRSGLISVVGSYESRELAEKEKERLNLFINRVSMHSCLLEIHELLKF